MRFSFQLFNEIIDVEVKCELESRNEVEFNSIRLLK